MKLKKFLSLIIVLAMTLSTMNLAVFAEEAPSAFDLQEKINSAEVGGTITIPEGTYTIDSQIIVDKAITIDGNDADKVHLIFDNASAAIMIMSSNVTIKNVTIEQGTQDNSCHISINRGGTYPNYTVEHKNIEISNVNTQGGDYCIFVTGENVTIDSCDFGAHDSNDIIIYSVRGDSYITNNTFHASNNILSILKHRTAILFEGGTPSDTSDNHDEFNASGNLTIRKNECSGKGNFFLFTNWGWAKDLNLDINNNTVTGINNNAVSLYSGSTVAHSGEFASIKINYNTFEGSTSSKKLIRCDMVTGLDNVVKSKAIDGDTILSGINAQYNFYGTSPNMKAAIVEGDNSTIHELPFYTDSMGGETYTGEANNGGQYYDDWKDALEEAEKGDKIVISTENISATVDIIDENSFKVNNATVDTSVKLTSPNGTDTEIVIDDLIQHVIKNFKEDDQGNFSVVATTQKLPEINGDNVNFTVDISIEYQPYGDDVQQIQPPEGETFEVKIKLPDNADLTVVPTVTHYDKLLNGVRIEGQYLIVETNGFSPFTISYKLKTVDPPAEMSKKAKVSFVEIDDSETATVYDIVIESTDGNDIFGLVSAQMNILEAADMSGVNFTVEGANDFIVTDKEDGSYLFTLKSADNLALASTKSGESVNVGKLTISGFTTDRATGNLETYTVNAEIGADDGAATSYLDTSVEPNETKNIHIALTGGTIDYEKAVPTQELTINVTFPKAVNENDADYQDMTITITEQDLGKVAEFKLGKNGDFEMTDGYYSAVAELERYKTYTVKFEGAGYRTFTKSLYLDADKTMSVWNNYKDNGTLIIVDGATEPEAKATITFLAGDIVKDNTVNAYDLSVLLSYAFTDGIDTTAASKYTQYDLNRDGLINYKDAAMILDTYVWGK